MSTVETSGQTIIDVPELIGSHKLGGYQIWILALCAILMFSSGFNMLTLGYMAPAVTADLKLHAGELGIVFVLMGVGNIIGAFAWGPIADRIGRKTTILISLLGSVPFIFLMSRATSLTELAYLQTLASFALAGPQNNCMPLASDFMPRHLKVTLTVLVWTGFSLGTIMVSPFAAFVVGIYGWRPVFLFNSLIPLGLVVIALIWLPESLKQLVRRPNTGPKVAKILGRMFPYEKIAAQSKFISSEKQQRGFPVRMLFTEGRATFTILLWVMGFANMISLFFMNSWLTTVLHNAGFVLETSILIAAVVHIGGIIGGIAISDAFDVYKSGRFYVLAASYALAAVFIAVLGYSGANLIWTTIAVFVAGFFLYGVQNSFNAVAAVLYPTEMRSTGGSWAQGIYHIAQMVGPMLGGILLGLHWPSNQLLYVIAVPPIASALAAVAMGVGHKAPETELEGQTQAVRK